MVVNASLLDDVEVQGELPAGVEVWTPGGARSTKPVIPAQVELWTPEGIKGPRGGATNGTLRDTLPPQARAQQATMLLPIAKKRNRHKHFAALAVAAAIAALAMLVAVLAWRHWHKNATPLREPVTAADKSDGR